MHEEIYRLIGILITTLLLRRQVLISTEQGGLGVRVIYSWDTPILYKLNLIQPSRLVIALVSGFFFSVWTDVDIIENTFLYHYFGKTRSEIIYLLIS